MSAPKLALDRLVRASLRRSAAVLALASMITAPKLTAATGDWNIDNNGATGWGTAANWLNGTIPNGVDDVANFTFDLTAARTINLDGSRTVGSMTIGDPTSAFGGYSLSANGQGGILTFDTSAGNASLTFTAPQGGTANAFNVPIQLNDTLDMHVLNSNENSFNGNITGTGGLNIDSSGTHPAGATSYIARVTLNGVNTFSGGLTITEARVFATNASSLGTGMITVNSGGQVLLTTSGVYKNDFTLNSLGWNELGPLVLGAIRSDTNSTFTGTFTLAGTSRLSSNNTVTNLVNGVIGESGGAQNLEINRPGGSAGTWVFNNTNTYTGSTIVSSGTLRVGDGGTTGSLGSTSGVELGNANLEFRRSDNVLVNTPFFQGGGTTGNFIHSGTGVLLLDNGGSGYTGATTVSGVNGKLVFGTGNAYSFAGTGNITLTNGADVEFFTTSNIDIFGAVVAAGSVNSFLIQSGSGTTTLGGGTDNNTGKAIVNAGTLVLGKASSSTVHSVGGAEINLVVNGGTAQLGGTGGDQIFTQSDVQVNGGILDLNGTSEGFDVLTGNGGVVTNTLDDASTVTLGEANSNVSIAGAISYNTTYGGVIQNGIGVVALTKVGTGLQTLSGVNTYTGATTINGGVLSITGSTSGSGAVAVNSGGTLSGTGTVGNVTVDLGGAIRPGATHLDTATGTLKMNSLTVNGGDLRVNLGASNDLINVTVTANFAAASNVSPIFSALPTVGTTTILIAGGGLTVGVAPTLAGIPVSTRSTFALNATSNTLELVTSGASAKSLIWTGVTSGAWDINTTANFDGGGVETFFDLDAVTFGDGPTNRTVTLADIFTPTLVTVNNSTGNNYTFQSGGIAGGGTSLTKTGAGVLNLNTANTFGGPVTITGGTLRAGSAAALGDTGGQTFVSGGGTLDLNGQNLGAEVINIAGAGVGGTGALTSSSGSQIQALRFLNLVGDATIGGTNRWDMRSAAVLDLAGHTITKTGANYVALVDTTITPGNIVVNQGTLAFSVGTVAQGGGTITANPGAIFEIGFGTTAANITRSITLAGGSISSPSGTNGANSNITLAANSTIDTVSALSLGGNISESGGSRSLTKTGASSLTLNGNNTFTGGIIVNGGTLNLMGNNAIGNASSIALSAGTLRLNFQNNYTLPATTLSNVNSSNIIFAGQTQGTTLTINSTIGSTTAFNALNLEIGTITLASGANVTVNAANIGQAPLNGNVGTLNVEAGAALTARTLWMGEGAAGRTGFVNQTGGTVTVVNADLGNDGALRIGHWSGTGASYNLSGGTLNVPNGVTGIGIDGSNASLNISGGTANLFILIVDARAGGTSAIGGTLNLSGGELVIGGGGLTAFNSPQTNLSGGTLSASAPSTWSVGMHFVNNAPTLDTRGHNVLLSGALHGVGGFTKTGNGRLTLSSAASLVGGTINANAGQIYVSGALGSAATVLNVNSGASLLLDGSGANPGLINGTVNVNSGGSLYGTGNGSTTGKIGTILTSAGAELRPGLTIGTLTADALTMNGGIARFELSGTSTTTGGGVNDLVKVTNGLTFNGSTLVPSFTTAPTSGNVYALFTSGTLTGLPTIDPSAAGSRLNYTVGGIANIVTLSVTGATKTLTWTGANGNAWNINASQNWADPAAEKFFQQDSVIFDGAAPGAVNLVGSIQPITTTVDAGVDYSFSGGSIDTGRLIKSGTGTLSLLAANGFSGGTTINAGTLSFANGALGSAGSITINGGTLQWNGANTQDLSSRIVMVGGTTASLDTNGNTVKLAVSIGGATNAGLTKTGTGTLILAGANNYTGATTVNGGTLSVGEGLGAGSIVGTSPITVGSGATMKFHNTAGTAMMLIPNTITSLGTLLLQGQNDLGAASQTGLYNITGTNPDLAGSIQINRAMLWDTLNQTDVGTAEIVVQDRGTMTFSGNTFSNNVTVEQGAGWRHNFAADASLGGIRLEGATNTLTGNIVLNNLAQIVLGDNTGANSTVGAYGAGEHFLTGVISGPGEFSMSRYSGTGGVAAIHLAGSASNTYAGKTVVDGQGGNASLWLEKTGGAIAIPANSIVQMGSGTGGAFNLRMGQNEQFGSGVVMNWVNASGQWGRFDLKGTTQTLAGINSGTTAVAGNGVIQNQGLDGLVPVGNAVLKLNGSGSYVYNGYIRDIEVGPTGVTLGVEKSGAGTQTLIGGNIYYSGPTTVETGKLTLIGTTGWKSSTTVNAGATLEWNTTADQSIANSSGDFAITGAGTFAKTGPSRLMFSAGTPVTRINMAAGGQVDVQGGTIEFGFVHNAMGDNLGSLNIATGASYYNSDAAASVDALTGGGRIGNAYSDNVLTLTIGVSGTTNNAAFGVATNTATFSGVISDRESYNGVTTADTAVVKTGAGTQIFSGANTYHGPTTVNGGTLIVTGSITGSAVTVQSGAILGGSGTINGSVTVEAGAMIAPGTSAGQLDVGDITLAAGAALGIEIGGAVAGTGYDQLNVTGTVTLGGDLSLSLINGFVPAGHEQFWITLNDGNDALSDVFGNVPITDVLNQSGTFTEAGRTWTVFYGADSTSGSTTGGNDVLLMVPEPGAVTSLLGGLGVVLGLRRRRRS